MIWDVKEQLLTKLHNFRFELLLAALLLLLFDKIFVADNDFFTRYVWPFNMIVLGLASVGIFKERNIWVQWLKNILFVISVLVPLFFARIVQFPVLTEAIFLTYTAYYALILVEVLRQIFQKSETTLSVVFGSVCGFLLLIVVALFIFLFLEYNAPGSFNGITGGSIPQIYNQLTYFSMVTLATVGYGDITPATETARLTTMFFAISGQFYMVALVGIIISRFTSK